MRSNKVTVSKPYSELSRHGKERFRVVVQTPSGKKCIVFNTLAEATRGRQRLQKLQKADYFQCAKTQAGNRRLSIPEALRDHFAALCAGKLPTEPLFAQDRPGPKKPRSTTSLHRAVQRICKTAGVTLICTPSLRGMNAELQLEGGIAEDVVAKSLGHTSIHITKTHYISRDTQDAIAAKRLILSYVNIQIASCHPHTTLNLFWRSLALE